MIVPLGRKGVSKLEDIGVGWEFLKCRNILFLDREYYLCLYVYFIKTQIKCSFLHIGNTSKKFLKKYSFHFVRNVFV